MSNIYIVEPPTNGKVLLKTTVGDIDLELWSKEAPRACRNFVQLCLEGYYHGTIFHRVVKGFIVQGGDPTGSGTGGESVYGQPFKDEFHSRLRFCRRGLLAMANSGKDDNASQFFFTLSATPELQNKHTIFGKVTGDTVFNMLKLEDALVDHDERPLYPQKIISTEVLSNPFPDIVPRNVPTGEPAEKKRKKEKASGVKNFKLLSFGEEAEEDEEETDAANRRWGGGRSKSTHDLLAEPGLGSDTGPDCGAPDGREGTLGFSEQQLASIRKKLRTKETADREGAAEGEKEERGAEEEEKPYELGQARREERKKLAEGIRKEIRELKRDMKSSSGGPSSKRPAEGGDESGGRKEDCKAPHIQAYEEEQDKYRQLQSKIPKKGQSREEFTLALLAKFKQKLAAAHQRDPDDADADAKVAEDKDGEPSDEEDWLSHRLHFEEAAPVVARDASTKGDDWFDITDPRNPINRRRREDGKQQQHASASRDRAGRR